MNNERTLIGITTAILIGAVVITLLVLWHHDDVQKHVWHDRAEAQTAQFARHMRCMEEAHCNSMGVRPHALPAQ